MSETAPRRRIDWIFLASIVGIAALLVVVGIRDWVRSGRAEPTPLSIVIFVAAGLTIVLTVVVTSLLDGMVARVSRSSATPPIVIRPTPDLRSILVAEGRDLTMGDGRLRGLGWPAGAMTAEPDGLRFWGRRGRPVGVLPWDSITRIGVEIGARNEERHALLALWTGQASTSFALMTSRGRAIRSVEAAAQIAAELDRVRLANTAS